MAGEWNKANPSLQVKEGDCIVAVNGAAGNAIDMLNESKSATVLKMKVQRK